MLGESTIEEVEGLFGDDIRVIPVAPVEEDRGALTELDFETVPFAVRRAFTVTGVPEGTTRGGHRHRGVDQLLTCITGAVEVELRRGAGIRRLTLSPASGALYLASGVWAAQRYLTADTTLLVLASEPFDPATYDPTF